jgi:hypothetical protein
VPGPGLKDPVYTGCAEACEINKMQHEHQPNNVVIEAHNMALDMYKSEPATVDAIKRYMQVQP